jgi:hypothetical protein
MLSTVSVLAIHQNFMNSKPTQSSNGNDQPAPAGATSSQQAPEVPNDFVYSVVRHRRHFDIAAAVSQGGGEVLSTTERPPAQYASDNRARVQEADHLNQQSNNAPTSASAPPSLSLRRSTSALDLITTSNSSSTSSTTGSFVILDSADLNAGTRANANGGSEVGQVEGPAARADAQDIAQGVDAQDIAEGVDAQDLAEGVDAQDLAHGVDTQDFTEAQDLAQGVSTRNGDPAREDPNAAIIRARRLSPVTADLQAIIDNLPWIPGPRGGRHLQYRRYKLYVDHDCKWYVGPRGGLKAVFRGRVVPVSKRFVHA